MLVLNWVQELDSNQWPSGYEPDALPTAPSCDNKDFSFENLILKGFLDYLQVYFYLVYSVTSNRNRESLFLSRKGLFTSMNSIISNIYASRALTRIFYRIGQSQESCTLTSINSHPALILFSFNYRTLLQLQQLFSHRH